MKLHLPLTLLTAVLATFIALPAQAVEAPEGYTTTYLNSLGTLETYSELTAEEYIAFILRRSQEITPSGADYWTSSSPLVSGGHVFFGSYNSDSPVALSFKDGNGSAFDDQSALTFDTLSNLTFSTITGNLAAISLANNGSLTITNVNDGQSDTVDVLFKDIKTSSYGGAIDASTVTISNNGDVSFSGNSASSYDYSRGGAIFAYDGITISHNADVSFSGNSSSSSDKYSEGGAICVNSGYVTISNNGDVSFSGNSASADDNSYGGAIYAYDGLTISHNGNVSFSGNSSSTYSYTTYSRGGAIYAGNGLTISHNGNVSFSGNSSSDYYSSSYSSGGAINAYAGLTISHNGNVSFSDNSAREGGAIYADYGDVTISHNGDVSFSGNSTKYDGGAIYASSCLTIQGNDSVLFEKNYENTNGAYRLSSIYSDEGMTLSAKTGGNITFYDSVYSYGATYLNRNYTDAEGNTQSAGGDVIFSGKYAEQHLNEILEANNENRMATAEEILNSQTSEFGGTIYLQNGSLQVVDGARLNGSGLQVSGEAKLLLRDSYMSHSGNSLTFATGTELELQGSNTLTATSLTLNAGATLTATLTDANWQQAALNLSGNLNISGALNLNLNVETEHGKGLYRIISLTDATVSGWTAGNITFNGSGAAAGASFGDLLWQDGVLYYVASPLWSNASGSGVWSCEDANWNSGSVFREGQDVLFSDIGAGTVQLSGDIAPDSISVNSNSNYIFTAAEDGGRLVGSTGISKTGSGNLTLATANAHTGDTELQEGSLNIQHSTALGATAEGKAALIAAEGTTITVENGSQVVLAAADSSIAGAVEIAEGSSLEMTAGSYAASNSTVNGSLILSEQTDVKLLGTTTVNGTLSLNSVNATAGTLSGNGSLQVKNSSVSFSDSGTYKGSLSVEGSNAELTLTKGGYKGSGTVAVQGGKLTLETRGGITLEEGGQLAVSDEATVKATSINIQEGATLSIGDVCAAVELNSLMSNEMAVYTTAAAEGYDPTVAVHTAVGAVLDTNSLNMFAGSTLIANGAHLDMNGADLTIDSYEEQKINLVLTLGANYTPDSQVVLFSNVGTVYLFMDDLFGVSGDEIVYTVNAGDYFTGEWINESTTLNYDSTANVVYLQGVSNVVPEPATATLSLLALAALAMRRRRK